MLILKIMKGDGCPDDSSQAQYDIHAGVMSVRFRRENGAAYADTVFAAYNSDLQSFELHGNAYVMNESGKTISSFGVADPKAHEAPGKLCQQVRMYLNGLWRFTTTKVVDDRLGLAQMSGNDIRKVLGITDGQDLWLVYQGMVTPVLPSMEVHLFNDDSRFYTKRPCQISE